MASSTLFEESDDQPLDSENIGKELRVRVLIMTKVHTHVCSIFFIAPGFLFRYNLILTIIFIDLSYDIFSVHFTEQILILFSFK